MSTLERLVGWSAHGIRLCPASLLMKIIAESVLMAFYVNKAQRPVFTSPAVDGGSSGSRNNLKLFICCPLGNPWRHHYEKRSFLHL
jgi:hypothetical protein